MLYRKGVATNQESERKDYKTLRRYSNNRSKLSRKKCQRACLQHPAKVKPNKVRRVYNNLIKDNSSRFEQYGQPQLYYMSYTRSLAAESTKAWYPEIVLFGTGLEFEQLVENAIIAEEKNKAVGTHKEFVEALRVKPSLCSKLLCQTGQRSSQLKYLF